MNRATARALRDSVDFQTRDRHIIVEAGIPKDAFVQTQAFSRLSTHT